MIGISKHFYDRELIKGLIKDLTMLELPPIQHFKRIQSVKWCSGIIFFLPQDLIANISLYVRKYVCPQEPVAGATSLTTSNNQRSHLPTGTIKNWQGTRNDYDSIWTQTLSDGFQD